MLFQSEVITMSKYIVIPSKKEDISKILEKDIEGIIIGVKSLSIYECELDVEDIINIANNTSKKIIVAINKMIHNDDLELVKEVLIKINKSKIQSIIFYDLGVFNLIKKLNIKTELIISQEHLNTSINSNTFYYNKGITSSFISSDITYNEILEIKKKTKMHIYYTVYGFLPIFYSKRKLLTSYFDYIKKDKTSNNYYMVLDNKRHLIKEKNYGSIIYSELVNLLNKTDKIKEIDFLVIDLSYINNINVIDKFLNKEKEDNPYIGFFDEKTIYKLKNDK